MALPRALVSARVSVTPTALEGNMHSIQMSGHGIVASIPTDFSTHILWQDRQARAYLEKAYTDLVGAAEGSPLCTEWGITNAKTTQPCADVKVFEVRYLIAFSVMVQGTDNVWRADEGTRREFAVREIHDWT